MYVTKYSRGELWNLKLSMDGMVGLQLFQLSSYKGSPFWKEKKRNVVELIKKASSLFWEGFFEYWLVLISMLQSILL